MLLKKGLHLDTSHAESKSTSSAVRSKLLYSEIEVSKMCDLNDEIHYLLTRQYDTCGFCNFVRVVAYATSLYVCIDIQHAEQDSSSRACGVVL